MGNSRTIALVGCGRRGRVGTAPGAVVRQTPPAGPAFVRMSVRGVAGRLTADVVHGVRGMTATSLKPAAASVRRLISVRFLGKATAADRPTGRVVVYQMRSGQ